MKHRRCQFRRRAKEWRQRRAKLTSSFHMSNSPLIEEAVPTLVAMFSPSSLCCRSVECPYLQVWAFAFA